MNKLLLYSVSCAQAKDNYNKTIVNSIKLKDIKKFLSNDEIREMPFINDNDQLHIWGCKDSAYYDRRMLSVKSDDIIAFSINKKFVIKGKVACVLKNKLVSKYCWGDEHFSHIIIIKNITKVKIPYEILFKDISYNPKAKVNGLVIVDTSKMMKLLEKVSSIDDYFEEYTIS